MAGDVFADDGYVAHIGLPGLMERVKAAVSRRLTGRSRRHPQAAKKRKRKKEPQGKRQSIRSVLRTIGQTRNDVGATAETHVVDLVQELARKKKIQCYIHATKRGELDRQQVDILILRRDDTWVPIQVKLSWRAREEFCAKYRSRWEFQHGRLPVVFVSCSSGFPDQQKALAFLFNAIEHWRGTFIYVPDL